MKSHGGEYKSFAHPLLNPSNLKTKTALVLSGGGAKGAYQIGCWQAFQEAGIRFDLVAGSSIGGLNGALICQGDMDRAKTFWEKMGEQRLIKLNPKKVIKLFVEFGK